jgi:hypothetical protein
VAEGIGLLNQRVCMHTMGSNPITSENVSLQCIHMRVTYKTHTVFFTPFQVKEHFLNVLSTLCMKWGYSSIGRAHALQA